METMRLSPSNVASAPARTSAANVRDVHPGRMTSRNPSAIRGVVAALATHSPTLHSRSVPVQPAAD